MSLLQCRCAQPLWALGIPDCHPVMRRIIRVAFETNLEGSGAPADFDLLNSTRYTDARRLMTPTLFQVESERPEPVVEELSGTKFWVKNSPRTFSALVPKPPAEWGINIEQLRCRSRLGVFLIDEAGVVWARLTNALLVAPIPIDTGSVAARMEFPSDTTVPKWRFSFDFAQGFEDYELVPVYANSNLTTYVAPIAARLTALLGAGSVSVAVYALYAQAAGNFFIPISGLASNIRIRDAANNVITATFTELAPGSYQSSVTLAPGTYTIDIFPVPTSTPYDFSTAVATIVVP